MLSRLLAIVATAWLLFAGAAQAEPSFSNPPAMTTDVAWRPVALPAGWVELPGVAFTVVGAASDIAVMRDLSDHGDRALPKLAGALGVPIGGEVRVYLAEDTDQFRTLQPQMPPEWADATAYPNLGAIFLRAPSARGADPKPLVQVLDHELIHILLGRAFAPTDVPHWLQEGVAQVYSGEAGPEVTEALSRGLRSGAAFSLKDLEGGFPIDPIRAQLAYAQSADFVRWMRFRFGESSIPALVQATRSGQTLAAAVHQVTGDPLDVVDADWKSRLIAGTPVWFAPGNFDDGLFALAGLAFLWVGSGRWRTRAQRMTGWRDHDVALGRLARELLAERRGGGARAGLHG